MFKGLLGNISKLLKISSGNNTAMAENEFVNNEFVNKDDIITDVLYRLNNEVAPINAYEVLEKYMKLTIKEVCDRKRFPTNFIDDKGNLIDNAALKSSLRTTLEVLNEAFTQSPGKSISIFKNLFETLRLGHDFNNILNECGLKLEKRKFCVNDQEKIGLLYERFNKVFPEHERRSLLSSHYFANASEGQDAQRTGKISIPTTEVIKPRSIDVLLKYVTMGLKLKFKDRFVSENGQIINEDALQKKLELPEGEFDKIFHHSDKNPAFDSYMKIFEVIKEGKNYTKEDYLNRMEQHCGIEVTGQRRYSVFDTLAAKEVISNFSEMFGKNVQTTPDSDLTQSKSGKGSFYIGNRNFIDK